MTNVTKNVIRTAVPAVIGSATAYLAKYGIKTNTTLAMAVMPITSTAYYSAIRWAENKYPKMSWLLGALPVK